MRLSTIQNLLFQLRSKLDNMDSSLKIPIVTNDILNPQDGEMWILKTEVIDPIKPDVPNITIDDVNNTVTGMTTDMEYNLDNSGYVTYNSTTFNAINFNGDHTLLVRVKAIGINPCSDVKILTFTTNTTVYLDTLNSTPLGKLYPFTLGLTDTDRKAAIIFKPTTNIILDNVSFKLYTLNSSTLHKNANPITIKLCPSTGGVPNVSNILETVSVEGISSIDTYFTRNSKFVNNVVLQANTEYAFLFSTSGTGASYYYTAGVPINNVPNYGANAYGSSGVASWQGYDETIEANVTIYKKVQ